MASFEQINVTAEQDPTINYSQEMGRITVFEALAEETADISIDRMGRTTMQGQVDFDD